MENSIPIICENDQSKKVSGFHPKNKILLEYDSRNHDLKYINWERIRKYLETATSNIKSVIGKLGLIIT